VTNTELRAVFERPSLEVARNLLGARLVRDDGEGQGRSERRRVGRIVEVEAYLGPADRASHARFGETTRSRPMYGEAGRAYVYLVYGMYHCLNVVTGPVGLPHAVLIRAVEPLEGFGFIRAARLEAERGSRRSFGPADLERTRSRLERTPVDRLAAGPGLVGAAFSLDRDLTGTDLLDPDNAVHLEPAPAGDPPFDVATSARIGIDYAGLPWIDQPWRFTIAGSPSLSR
jgi:DNA-3-methyladenine glycosylase